ncbi:hypothetical protein [Salinibacterium sp. SWN1162]|uniref:hypothetical protein n=1 Tax=Salinibacterium sp. SWN1162 TaxID=2792053 RepID=UPI0018CF232D|nr:hypothetical protein [Salinibacterium sp. SWN1162]MBH0007908.1 hypothetical protein [Salinibacterium sp. SWN1162]
MAADNAVRAVEAYLPFAMTLEADMGGMFALHIDLGTRGNIDDLRDTACIDPEDDDLQWCFDIAGGTTAIALGLRIDARPWSRAWVTDQARRAGSPSHGWLRCLAAAVKQRPPTPQ